MAKQIKKPDALDQEQPEKNADPDAPIYARATKVGYYGLTRHYPVGYDHPRAGHVFMIEARDGISKVKGRPKEVHLTAEAQFSHNWMERVSEAEGNAALDAQGRSPKKNAVIHKTAADRSAAVVI